jgi:hypothetical protein
MKVEDEDEGEADCQKPQICLKNSWKLVTDSSQ